MTNAHPTADPLTRALAGAALVIALIALFVSLGDSSPAAPPVKAKAKHKTIKLRWSLPATNEPTPSGASWTLYAYAVCVDVAS